MNEDFKELDALLKGFVEESLSDSEQKKLEKILKTDSTARQRYLDYIAVESMLGSHRAKVEHTEPASVKPKLKVSTLKTGKVKKKTSSKARNSGAFLIMAASLFLALSLGYYMKFLRKSDTLSSIEKPVTFLAKIEKMSGDATVIIDGKAHKASEGFVLSSGAEIKSSKTAELDFKLHDGSTIKLAPASTLIFSQVNGQFSMVLKNGFLKADVNKQPSGKPLLISTSNAKMTVLGTVLRVSLSKSSTNLTVDEGRVEIQNSQNQKAIVNSDESVIALPGKDLEVRSLKAYKVEHLEILSAFYGAEDKWVDITPQVRSRAGNSRLIVTGNFKNLAGDPNYGIVKSLKISYKIDGKKGSVTVREYTGDVVNAKFFTTEVILPKL